MNDFAPKHRKKPSYELTDIDAHGDIYNNKAGNLSEILIRPKKMRTKGLGRANMGQGRKYEWICKCKRIHRKSVEICPACEDVQKH